MNDEAIWALFEEVIEETKKDHDACCGKDMLMEEDDGMLVCDQCGHCVVRSIVHIDENVCSIRYRSVYKPIKHFETKLREISGLIIPHDTIEWRGWFAGMTINNVGDVRRILKKGGHSNMNRYTYYFFQELTGIVLFSFDNNEKQRLVKEFIRINNRFKRIRITAKRKNMVNYHFIFNKILTDVDPANLFSPCLPQSVAENEAVWALISGV
jgi:hypothetical protein